METRKISEQYAEVAKHLIREEKCLEYIAQSEVKILYLSSDKEKCSKGKVIFGECEKVPDKYKWAIPYDFTITVFEPNVEEFTEEQIKTLLLHELLHVGVDFSMDGSESYHLNPHDIEDFRLIIDRFGMDWNRFAGLNKPKDEFSLDLGVLDS